MTTSTNQEPTTMITVTFQFTTLAEALAALGGLPAGASVKAEAPAPKPQAEKTADPKPEKASSAATPAAASASAKPKESAASQAPAADEPLAYEVLQKAVFKLASLSRDAAGAVNQKFGVKTMKDLPEGKRREALAAVEAAIVEAQQPTEEMA